MISGTAFGPVLNVLIMPVLSRLYTPEDFGILAVFNAALTVLVTFPGLRYESAIPLPEDDDDAKDLQLLSLALTVAASAVTAVAVWLFSSQIAALLNAEQLAPYLWLLPLALFGAGVFKVVSYWNVRLKRFGDLARASVARPTAMAAVSILLGLVRMGQLGLVVGSFAGQACAALTIVLLAVWRDGRQLLRAIRPERILELMRIYRQFPLYQLPAALLNACSQQVSLIVMAALYDMTIVGHYGVARRIFSVPMFILVQAVAQVFLQRTAEEYNRGGDLRQLVLRLYRKLFYIGIIPTLLLFALAPWACSVALGAEYAAAGEYTRLLIPWLFLAFISSPTSCVFSVLDRQNIMLGYIVVLLAARMLAVWAGFYYFNSAYWSIALYACVGVIGNIYIMYRTWQIADPQLTRPMLDRKQLAEKAEADQASEDKPSTVEEPLVPPPGPPPE